METTQEKDLRPYPAQCRTQLMKYTKNPPLYYCLAEKPLPNSCNFSFSFGTAHFCKHPHNVDFVEDSQPIVL